MSTGSLTLFGVTTKTHF